MNGRGRRFGDTWRAGLLVPALAGALLGAGSCLAQQPTQNPGSVTAARPQIEPMQAPRPAPVGPESPAAPGEPGGPGKPDGPGKPGGASHPRPDAEDALAMLVQRAGIIFAGEVYAIRMPGTEASPGTSGGAAPSPNSNAVEIEFRVDQAIRGTSIGTPYVLREWPGLWQNRPAPFQLHQRGVFLLYAPNQAGLSSPVGGESGIFLMDGNFQVDLTRLHALEGKPDALSSRKAAAGMAGAESGPDTTGDPAGQSPAVPPVTTTAGEQTLLAGADEGRMDDLEQKTVPFLAFLRDLFVLSAAEGGGPAGSTSNAPRHEKPAPASRPPQ